MWSFLSIAIAKRRGVDSSLFIEDAGFIADPSKSESEVEDFLEKKALQVAYSQVCCGDNQDVAFTEIFISWRKLKVNEGEYGTALTCAPYITLAGNAYPKGSSSEESAQQLIDMSLEQWKGATTLNAAPQPTCLK